MNSDSSRPSSKVNKVEETILNGQVKYCDCCKRRFIQSHGNIYKLKIKGAKLKFCSYTCYRKIQVLKEDKKYDEIVKIIDNNFNNTEVKL